MEMKSIISFLFLLHALINVFNLGMAQRPQDVNVTKCRPTGNFTSPNYKTNLISALNAVAKNIGAHSGFYHTTAGTGSEQVNAVGLCPGYVHPHFCEWCLNKSVPLLQTSCPKQKEGVWWAVDCMVRYSDRKISGVLDDWFWVSIPDKMNVIRPAAEMDKALYGLATKLQPQAAGGNSVKKYATGEVNYAPNSTLTLVLQCTPDLSKEQCNKCLYSTILTVHSCCSGKVAARMVSPNCYLRYDHLEFRY